MENIQSQAIPTHPVAQITHVEEYTKYIDAS